MSWNERILNWVLKAFIGAFCGAIVSIAGGPHWSGIMTTMIIAMLIAGPFEEQTKTKKVD